MIIDDIRARHEALPCTKWNQAHTDRDKLLAMLSEIELLPDEWEARARRSIRIPQHDNTKSDDARIAAHMEDAVELRAKLEKIL